MSEGVFNTDTIDSLIASMRQWIKAAVSDVTDQRRTPVEIVNELPELLCFLEELEVLTQERVAKAVWSVDP